MQANSAIMVDGMALLQSITKIPTTCEELARKVLGILVNMDNNENTSRVDFVCDQYIIPSIKDSERERLGSTGSVHMQIGSAYQNVQNSGTSIYKLERIKMSW